MTLRYLIKKLQLYFVSIITLFSFFFDFEGNNFQRRQVKYLPGKTGQSQAKDPKETCWKKLFFLLLFSSQPPEPAHLLTSPHQPLAVGEHCPPGSSQSAPLLQSLQLSALHELFLELCSEMISTCLVCVSEIREEEEQNNRKWLEQVIRDNSMLRKNRVPKFGMLCFSDWHSGKLVTWEALGVIKIHK